MCNAAVALGTAASIKGVVSLCDFLVSRKALSPPTSRKIVHIAAGCWMLSWPLFDAEGDGWSWRLNALVTITFAARFAFKGLVKRDPEDEDVRSMTRTGDPKELLYGPFQFAVVGTAVGLFLFMREESCLIMAALGWGDGIAPIVGRLYGRHRYKALMGGSVSVKTVEGSVGVLLGTILGYYIFARTLGLPELSFWSVLVGGIVAAAVEGCSPDNFDNIALPVAMYFLYPFLRS